MTKDEIQSEALIAIGSKKKAGVEMSMGSGKTVLGLKHMDKSYNELASFLVVAPRVTIFASWQNDAKDRGFSYLLPHIQFSTYLSLTTFNPYDYDVIYLDECHSLTISHEKWLIEFEERGGTIIGLTGTYPPGLVSEKAKMCNRFCPKVYEYSTDEAVEDDILNDYRIFVHMLHLSSAPTMPIKTKNGGEFMTSELKTYEYWDNRVMNAFTAKDKQITRIQRMKALQQMPGKLNYAKKLFDLQTKKTLVFANTKEQADFLSPDRIHSGVEKKLAAQTLQDLMTGKIQKASAVDQLSEGVTIPELEVGIIMHAYGNDRKTSQKLGRFLRLTIDKVGIIHILCYLNSVDKEWVENALSKFDQSKIKWIHPV